jgi:diguanylate cyclase (GGDEF)-like protein/PAS domain S-box-containing protein
MNTWLDTPILFITTGLSIIAARIVWQRRQTPGAISLTLLLLAATIWNFASALKNISADISSFIILAKIEILGSASTTTLFLIFIIEFTRQNHLLSRRRLLFLWIIPLISVALAFSNELHHYFWLSADYDNEANRFILTQGKLVGLHFAYYYLTRVASTLILVQAILRYPSTYRLQAAYLLAGTIATWLSNTFDMLPGFAKYYAWEAALHPIAYTLSGLIIGLGVMRHRLFDLVPIARETVLENIRDGIIALDTNKHIVDINLPARYLLQISPEQTVIGTSLEETLKHIPELRQKIFSSEMPYQDVYIPKPIDLTLEIMTTPIFDRQGQARGTMITIHDISSRTRSEAALRQSEENLRNVFENAPFPVIVASLSDGRILYVNPAGVKLYNTSILNLGDMRAQDFYKDARQRRQLILKLKKTGRIDNFEIPIRIADGRIIWVASSICIINYNGEETLLITQMDISERKKAEEELQKSRAQLKNIFEHADAGIHLVDPSGSITFSNERWAEMLGDSSSSLTGRNLSDFVFKNDIPYSRHLFESLIGGEIERYQLELRYRRSDDSIFWGALSAIPIYTESGEIESIVNFVNDITQKKQTESTLRETERRFREILEKVYLFAIMLDTEGNVTFCNEHLLSATGWRKNEILGKNWFETFLPKDSASRRDDYTRAIQRGAIVSRHENEILTSNNKILLVAWSNIVLRDENGNATGTASIGEDITERRRAHQSEKEQRVFAEALYDTAAAITSTLHFEEVLDRILDNLDHAVEADAANISIIEHGKIRFVRAKGYEKYGLENQEILKVNFSIRGLNNLRVITQSKEPLCIPDTRNFPGWKEIPTSKWIRSYVGAPIIVKDKVVGFISLDSETPGYFNDIHAERLKAFSQQAAIAMDNTRLYSKSLREIEERKRAQSRLRRANQKLKIQLTEIENLQAKLREQAIRDALTGLHNRRYMEEVLPKQIEECRKNMQPLSIIMIDIDHFKAINDTHGHPIGDKILQSLGLLLGNQQPQSAICCRYGGEEFIVIYPNTELEIAYLNAEKLRETFAAQRTEIGSISLQATLSIGVASMNKNNTDMLTLLTAADKAMYQAKQAGRNLVKTSK